MFQARANSGARKSQDDPKAARCLLLRQERCLETGQMSAVETGQMSAAETGQMSSAGTRQMLKSQAVGLALNYQ